MLILVFSATSISAKSQTETLTPGSFIINMGATTPNTIANGIKPYGIIYDLIRNFNVPVKRVISQTEEKDGVYFAFNRAQNKGSTSIIAVEFRSPPANTRVYFLVGYEVVGNHNDKTFFYSGYIKPYIISPSDFKCLEAYRLTGC